MKLHLQRLFQRAAATSGILLAVVPALSASDRVIDARMHHLRAGETREWSDFPAVAEGHELRVEFTADANPREATLWLRQQDVKQSWRLRINDREIGRLPQDENPQVTFWTVPPGTLRDGVNTFQLTGGQAKDDIWAGNIQFSTRAREAILSEATLDVRVVDASTRQPLPCRVTIVDSDGALVSLGASSSLTQAVRPGVIYTANGHAACGVPAGRYTVFAGRGFEYGVASTTVELAAGAHVERQLLIAREVDTTGYVCCDTHCHTLTHSGHGDATLAERMITLAAEGVELPVATDHNVAIDYQSAAVAGNVRSYFTPIVGSEVTTPHIGHFNVFPLAPGAPPIDHNAADWPTLFQNIRRTPGAQVCVLNHARDLHGGFRPFGPRQHLGIAGENVDGWRLEANAMEVINSGALQTDPLQLFRDWFGMLNRGVTLAPVAGSDSHDVARHFVGQARTYIACRDDDPAAIDVPAACAQLVAGRVVVSLGLLAELKVNGQFGPGDLLHTDDPLDVVVRVSGPGWTEADRVVLYANGIPIRDTTIDAAARSRAGVKWEGGWRLPAQRHDVYLAAIATGPGVTQLYWPIPKAYQPTSTDWKPYVLGATGAVRVDADQDGQFAAPHTQAARLATAAGRDLTEFVNALADYDEAVAVQAASLWQAAGGAVADELTRAPLNSAAPQVQAGFAAFSLAWRDHLRARVAEGDAP